MIAFTELSDSSTYTVYDIKDLAIEPISTLPLLITLLGIGLWLFGKRSRVFNQANRSWLSWRSFVLFIAGLLTSVAGLIFFVINIYTLKLKGELKVACEQGQCHTIQGVITDLKRYKGAEYFIVNGTRFYYSFYEHGAYTASLFPNKKIHNGAYVYITYHNSSYLKTDDTHDILVFKVAK